jgi:hypothetical protein
LPVVDLVSIAVAAGIALAALAVGATLVGLRRSRSVGKRSLLSKD